MKRAVIYARISKDRDESVSIEAQIAHCTARARQLGAEVVKVFRDEGISGRQARNRAAFLRAKDFCAAASIDYFIVWSTSRFARNILELFQSEAELRAIGTKLECLNADIDDETDTGLINKTINGLMDEMYSRQVARDTLRSQKLSAAAGFWTGGNLPFGYRTVKDGVRSRLVVDDAEADQVREIFRLCQDGLGAQVIAESLNRAGRLRRGKPWGKTTVAYLLNNEIYTGVRTFNKKSKRAGIVKPPAEWVKVDGHPAVISREDFERVQAMLDERVPHHEHGGTPRSNFLFTGIARCGICSEPLQIRTGKGRSGEVYSYYACMAHKKGAPRCMFRAVPAEKFDAWMLGEVMDHVVTPQAMELALADLLAMGDQWAKEREARRAELVATIRQVEERKNQLLDLLELNGRNTPDLENVLRRLRERGDELDGLQRELAQLEEARRPVRRTRIEPETLQELTRELIDNSDTKKKRAFLGAFIERVTLATEGVTIEYRPEALLDAGTGASVRSVKGWLPAHARLRTRTLCLPMPRLGGTWQRRQGGTVGRARPA